MIDWQKTLVSHHASIRQAMAVIETAGVQIGLVVDDDKRLLGTVTDGDIRRAILGSAELADLVVDVMRDDPTTVLVGTSRPLMLEAMQERSIRQLPVLDSEGRVVDLKLLDELLAPEPRDNWVVLQAGGMGTRLRPLTSETPKPMLKVGKRPILETILISFRNAGFRRFYMSVNYKRERIKEHFGDGSVFGVQIRYLEEEEGLGTAGALGLLPEAPKAPMIVMNADLLTGLSFGQLLDFHVQSGAPATICVRDYDVQIPFGVVEIESETLVRIREKPVHTFFVNAGVYVLDPLAIKLVKKGQHLDMPQLFERLLLLKDGKKPAVFPIREYWLDIGRVGDFVKANLEYDDVFE